MAAGVTFLDTGGLVARFSPGDGGHAAAVPVWNRFKAARTPLLTTSLVLVEVGDYCSRVADRPAGLKIRDVLTRSKQVEIVQVTPDHEWLAWQMFERTRDKEWGMTDCVSFVVMEEREIREAFTGDHHFRQAGFTPLLPVRGN